MVAVGRRAVIEKVAGDANAKLAINVIGDGVDFAEDDSEEARNTQGVKRVRTVRGQGHEGEPVPP